MKILITGYSRSGTTMLRHLIRGHKHVKHILHETMLLVGARGIVGSGFAMWAWNGGEPIKFSFDYDNEVWGEKILYDYPCMDYGVFDALDYCLFWNELFLPDAIIINIIRHPFDVVISSAMKKRIELSKAMDIYKRWMPWMWEEIEELPNSKTFKFEDLLFATQVTLEEVFDCCGLDSGRGAVKQAVSRARTDLQGGRLNSGNAYKYVNNYGYTALLADKGLCSIAEKLGYGI